MNPTTRAILQTVMTSDSSLSEAERGFVQRLLNGDLGVVSATVAADGERLLVTQKRAAELLSVNRVTIWRMTKDGMLNPVEILPGTLRYRLNEITRLAQAGTDTRIPPQREQGNWCRRLGCLKARSFRPEATR